MAFGEILNFIRRLFFSAEKQKEMADLKVFYTEALRINEQSNEVIKANAVLVDELNTKIKSLEARLYYQKQAFIKEKETEISNLREEHQKAIDTAITQYEGKAPRQNGCACHDRSCCVAGKCQRLVRYRAADGQGFCGTCFVKRNTKEFVDLKPVQPRLLRKTATAFPALSTDSSDRPSNLLVTKDNFSE